MYCTRNITEELIWVGGNDRRLSLFEGIYSVPDGVAYNSYLLLDKKTVLFDTVDQAVGRQFFENLASALKGRALDYLVVHHMEPDHSAVMEELIEKYPGVRIVCNQKSVQMIRQYFTFDVDSRAVVVKEGDVLETGNHRFTFMMAPMVHWPEVMVTYEPEEGLLFSADAFGCFGALNGALFADEVDFARDYLDEARRYYTNIVGKYGPQVQALLKKLADKEIRLLLPLHGFVWRKDVRFLLEKYQLWSAYLPEEQGVMIVYGSVYGDTENAAEILACRLREKDVKTCMYDVSVTPASEILSACFRWSHLVFASITYNTGIFVSMESLLTDIAAHNLQNRTVAFIENGSWAPQSGKLMRQKLEACKNMTFAQNSVTIKSAVKEEQLGQIEALAQELSATAKAPEQKGAAMQTSPLQKLSYGLFVLSARDGGRDNACIINTAIQVTSNPEQLLIAVNKSNLTHDMIVSSQAFALSILSQKAEFAVFKRFGFASGRDTDKFAGLKEERTPQGLRYVSSCANAVIDAAVVQMQDCGTHTVFLAEIRSMQALSDVPSATYAYYHSHIKPQPEKTKEPAAEGGKKRYVCKICGYVYEGEELPPDFVCPICKHGAVDFELKL